MGRSTNTKASQLYVIVARSCNGPVPNVRYMYLSGKQKEGRLIFEMEIFRHKIDTRLYICTCHLLDLVPTYWLNALPSISTYYIPHMQGNLLRGSRI